MKIYPPTGREMGRVIFFLILFKNNILRRKKSHRPMAEYIRNTSPVRVGRSSLQRATTPRKAPRVGSTPGVWKAPIVPWHPTRRTCPASGWTFRNNPRPYDQHNHWRQHRRKDVRERIGYSLEDMRHNAHNGSHTPIPVGRDVIPLSVMPWQG